MKKSIASILVLLLLSSMTGCTNDNSSAPELMEPVGVKLDTAVATRSEIYLTTVYKGEVVPYVEELSFSVDGSLGECLVKVGDAVEKDQILVTLDINQLQKQIDTLETEIAHIQKMGTYSDRITELDIAVAEAQLELLYQTDAAAGVCKDKALETEQRKLDLAQARELRSLELQQKEQTLERLKKQMREGITMESGPYRLTGDDSVLL